MTFGAGSSSASLLVSVTELTGTGGDIAHTAMSADIMRGSPFRDRKIKQGDDGDFASRFQPRMENVRVLGLAFEDIPQLPTHVRARLRKNYARSLIEFLNVPLRIPDRMIQQRKRHAGRDGISSPVLTWGRPEVP